MCTEFIRQSINEFSWKRDFLNTNINGDVDIVNSTVLNIFSNFIPNEFVVCDDMDQPWFKKEIRALFQEEKVLHLNIIVIIVVTLI